MTLAHPRSINILATCTQKKSAPAGPRQQIRNLGAGPDVSARVGEWFEALADARNDAVAAAELYKGDHWQIARSMDSGEGPSGSQVWVCSTGYGLVSLDDQLVPYQASFSPPPTVNGVRSVGDQVGQSPEERKEWWATLAEGSPPGVGAHPRSIQDLVRRDPKAGLLVALSPPYLSAVEEDLAAAIELVHDPDQVIIVSVGKTTLCDALASFVLPIDSRLKQVVGGTMLSLNVRVAAYVLNELSGPKLSFKKVCSDVERLMVSLPKLVPFNREKASDDAVLRFIRSELQANPKAACTPLLRKFRDSGVACEQGRFKSLYAEVQEAPLFQ